MGQSPSRRPAITTSEHIRDTRFVIIMFKTLPPPDLRHEVCPLPHEDHVQAMRAHPPQPLRLDGKKTWEELDVGVRVDEVRALVLTNPLHNVRQLRIDGAPPGRGAVPEGRRQHSQVQHVTFLAWVPQQIQRRCPKGKHICIVVGGDRDDREQLHLEDTEVVKNRRRTLRASWLCRVLHP